MASQTLDNYSATCADCGAVYVKPCEPTFSTGFCTTPDGTQLCNFCGDLRQIAALKERKPVSAYMAQDGRSIQTWPGGHLAHVYDWAPCKLTRASYAHGKDYRTFKARDVHGGLWFGRGSPGVCLTMRPVKAK